MPDTRGISDDGARSVEYIHQTLSELRMIAQDAGHELLTYTIGIAIYEAERSRKAARKKSSESATNIKRLYLPDGADT